MRRRFEFAPVGMPGRSEVNQSDLTTIESSELAPSEGPDSTIVVALDPRVIDPLSAEAIDLTTVHDVLELRVWVYVERASSPTERRGTWTRHTSKWATSKLANPDAEPTDTIGGTGTVWTTVARDTAYERRLLAVIETLMTK